MGKKQVKNHIKEYIKRIKKDIKPDKVILYGSFAKGTHKEGSDIDMIVVSDHFSNMDEDKRLELLYRKTVQIPLDFHLYGITSDELTKISPLTSLSSALKRGTTITV